MSQQLADVVSVAHMICVHSLRSDIFDDKRDQRIALGDLDGSLAGQSLGPVVGLPEGASVGKSDGSSMLTNSAESESKSKNFTISLLCFSKE